MPRLAILLILVSALVGCAAPATSVTPAAADASSVAAPAPQILTWSGHIVDGSLDMLGHDQPGERVIFPLQQAGFLVEIKDKPQAIEVRVDWQTPGAEFMLHPHFLVGDDASGTTRYNGYMSPMFSKTGGCIRIPDAEMAPGIWPMMVHPSSSTTNADFTLRVAILGAQGSIMKDLHGHRADGKYVIDDHKVEACQLLASG